MTGRIPSATPPVETTKTDGLGPKRPAVSTPSEPLPDGAQVSELSRAVAAALRPDDQKIEALRQAVAAGTYAVDPVKVIEKMLPIENPE